MKVPIWLSSILVTSALAALGWLCLVVMDLRTDNAVFKNDLASIKQTLSVMENRSGTVATR